MKYALILAGGTGSRMGNIELPKQFLNIGTKPIVIHTIEQFILSRQLDKIVVVVHKDWKNHLQDLLEKYDLREVEITIGGTDRNDTIKNGCEYIIKKYGVHDNDIILTHDAVRPFITNRIIRENIEKMAFYDAVDTIIPAADTIVEAENNQVIDIPVRSKMFQGQTPQTFKLKQLLELISDLSFSDKANLTDACKVYSLSNKKIGYVLGENYNFKITTQYDLKIANKIVTGDINL